MKGGKREEKRTRQRRGNQAVLSEFGQCVSGGGGGFWANQIASFSRLAR